MMRSDHTCNEAREALWEGAEEHLASCPECRRVRALDEALGRRLARLRTGDAPELLRQRIRAALSAERVARPSRRAWLGGAGLAAAAALAILLGVRGPSETQIAMSFITEAATGLSRSATFSSSEAGEIEAWLEGETGHEIQLPDISDASLVGGRVVNVAGVPAAAAVYDFHGEPLTYFALPQSEMRGLALNPESDIWSAAAEGYEVAAWGEPDGLRAVAAPVRRAVIKAVAVECRTKALRGLF